MKSTEVAAFVGTRTYNLLSSSTSSFFCVPFGGYAMLSCSKHTSQPWAAAASL